MKTIVSFILCFLTCNHLQSQQLKDVSIYKNDSSYLILNKDTAEFKIHKKNLSHRCLAGKGLYHFKDSMVYINTALSDEEYYPKFEDVGCIAFNEKLSIEVFNHLNNTKILKCKVYIYGKSYYEEDVNDGLFEIDFQKLNKRNTIRIYAVNDAIQKHFVPLNIPVKSIKSNKINVYLTDINWIRNEKVKFKLEKNGNSYCITGPVRDEPKPKIKINFNFKYGFHRAIYIKTHSTEITMCSE